MNEFTLEIITFANFIEKLVKIAEEAHREIEDELSNNLRIKSNNSAIMLDMLLSCLRRAVKLVEDMKKEGFIKGVSVLEIPIGNLIHIMDKFKSNIILDGSKE